MKRCFLSFLFLLIFFTKPFTQVLTQDSLALVALYNATNGPQWKNKTNWLQGPVSKWYGVTVQSNRVYLLNLWDNGLSGTIPNEIGFLTGLVELSLGMSAFQGPIPASIGQLSELYDLNLRRSGLQGAIPSTLGQCSKLAQLYLSENQFEGGVPASLSQCKELYSMLLHKNQLSGRFPEAVLNLPKLRSLDLSDNQFSGPLPTGISDMIEMRSLSLSRNQFSGSLPGLSKLVKLESLLLEENQLDGRLDTLLSYHPELSYCYLNNNQFTGLLSPSHFNPQKIVRLRTHENRINQLGDFSSWSNHANFIQLLVSKNQLDFDDLSPNLSLPSNKFFWYPQQAIGRDTTIIAPAGSRQVISSPMQNPQVEYKWFHNAIPITGAKGPNFTIESMEQDSTGSYVFYAIHPAYPQFELISANRIFKLPTATKQLLGPKDYSFFWDPETNEIRIKWFGSFHTRQVHLFDANGRRMQLVTSGEPEHSLSIPQYPAGIYILLLQTEKGRATLRFVKQ